MKKRMLLIALVLLFLIPCLPLAVFATGNNSIVDAKKVSVNKAVTDNIAKSADEDYFKFTLSENGYINITFEHEYVDDDSYYWRLYLYDSSETLINSWNYFGNEMKAWNTQFIGLPKGTYYILVTKGTRTSNCSYTFRVNYTASESWETEFNEDPTKAESIAVNKEYAGTIYKNADKDYYKFTTSKDGYLNINFHHEYYEENGRCWNLYLYNDALENIVYYRYAGDSVVPSTTTSIGLPAGTYYVEITKGSYLSTVPYYFTVGFTAADDWETESNKNISLADPIAMNKSRSGSLLSSNDTDYYTFQVEKAGNVYLDFAHDFVDKGRTWAITLYDQNNTQVKVWRFNGNVSAMETVEIALTAGKYYLKVASATYYSDAVYTITVRNQAVGNVTRVFGPDRYQTAFQSANALKKVLGVSKFQNIVVACGTNFPDALAGTYLASQKDAPILLVRGSNVKEVNEYIKNNLAPGGTLYLLGDSGVIPNTVGQNISGITVKRLGGATRYDTNLLILKEAGVANKDIIVCTGINFADSLSASACGMPILLVKDGLLPAQKEFLKSVNGNFYIIGGTNAVSSTVEKQLAAYGSVTRIGGSNRYETSVLVAKAFFTNPSGAVLAYAQNFPDGLCGGPLAYNIHAPMILTDSNKPNAAIAYATGLGIKSGYVLGSSELISDNVTRKIFSMASGDTILQN